MSAKLKTYCFRLAVFSVLIALATIVMAEARTNITIKNYSDQTVVVQIKQVKLNGEIEWVEIGDINAKRARAFSNVTIGSVLRVVPKGGGDTIKEFRVQSAKGDYRIE